MSSKRNGKTTEETALAKPETGSLVLPDSREAAMMNEMVNAAIQTVGIRAFMPHVTIKGAGTTAFGMPNDEGEEDLVKDFVGVVLHSKRFRICWEGTFAEGAGQMPLCHSEDMEQGPLGNCRKCEYDAWGSRGKGKQCQERCWVYVLPQGKTDPHYIDLPVSSTTPYFVYCGILRQRSLSVTEVLTTFNATKATNKDGIVYTKVEPEMTGRLSAEDYASLEKLRKECVFLADHTSSADLAVTDSTQLTDEERAFIARQEDEEG